MASKSSSLFAFALLILLLFCPNHANALNITKTLANYSHLSSFNDLLTDTKLADKINKRQTITLLALDNDAAGMIKGRPEDELQTILSNHIVLDYYDAPKLKKLDKKGSTMTTLYQTSGSANGGQGFLNVKQTSSGDIVFGSGVKGSPLVAKLVKSVYSQPFNLSILQVSMPIVAPGVGDPILPPPPPPYSAPPPSSSSKKGAPSPKSKSSTSTETGEDSSEAPSSEYDSPTEAPAPSPTEAPVPSAREPPPSDVPDFIQPPSNSSASTMYISSTIGVAGVMAFVLNFAGL